MREERILGACFVILSGIMLWLAFTGATPEDQDAPAVLLTLPLGVYLIFSDAPEPHRRE